MPLAVENIVFHDQALVPIWDKVRSRERLDFDDGLAVLRSWDLTAIGKMADFVKRRKSGDDVFFVMNRQINPTNLCVLDCVFCDFAARPGDAHAYEMTIEEILGKLTPELSEVHIVGGLHPKWKFEQYLGIMEAIHEAYPTIQIKAWTAVEIDWFARIAKMEVPEVLERLQSPGFLSFIPLALQPGATGLAERQASAIEDLRTVAAARLLLDNFPHIKSYWIMLGEETASVALNFGASDLDGTIGEQRIAHYAQAKSAVGLAREKLVEMIREAGKRPVERDALYNVVRAYD